MAHQENPFGVAPSIDDQIAAARRQTDPEWLGPRPVEYQENPFGVAPSIDDQIAAARRQAEQAAPDVSPPSRPLPSGGAERGGESSPAPVSSPAAMAAALASRGRVRAVPGSARSSEAMGSAESSRTLARSTATHESGRGR